MSKSVIYARVSTKDQLVQGYSINAQLAALRDYAVRHSLSVVKEFIESESAGDTGRRKLREMIGILQRDVTISAVLVWKVDRLYRNLKDRVLIDDLIRERGLHLHLAYEGKVMSRDTKPSDWLALDVHTDVARYELANLRERVIFGLNQKASQGEYPGGRPPLGYVRNPVTKGVELDPDRAPIIHRLFELYAQGECSIDDVYTYAKNAGLRYRKSNKPISRSEIERMLKKPFYTGKFTWNSVVYQGDHPALVDGHLFERVQEMFRKRSNGRFAKHDYLFSKMITCGECGLTVTAETKKGKYTYYHCTAYGKRHKPVYVPEPVLENQFGQIVGEVTLPGDWYEYLKTCLETESHNRLKALTHERKHLELTRDKIQTNMKKAFQAKLDGIVDNDFFKQVFGELQAQLDAYKHRLEALPQAVDARFDLAFQTIELSYQLDRLYLNANFSQKRKLLRTVLSNCTLDGVTLTPTYRKPFDLIAKGVVSNNKLGDRDSNPDTTVQSRVPYHWTISQYNKTNRRQLKEP